MVIVGIALVRQGKTADPSFIAKDRKKVSNINSPFLKHRWNSKKK